MSIVNKVYCLEAKTTLLGYSCVGVMITFKNEISSSHCTYLRLRAVFK